VPDAVSARRRRASTRRPMQMSFRAGFLGWNGAQRGGAAQNCVCPDNFVECRSKTRVEAPRMRLICFTNAGNEENVFTNEGLGPRRVAVLLEWCRANKVELLAPQLPGRGARSKEPFLSDAQVCV